LHEILEQQVIQRYRTECEREGVGLQISAAVKRKLVQQCLRSGSGARGLATALNHHMEDACYRAFSSEASNLEIQFRHEHGEIAFRIRER
jgi:ATP-dependent Clp protease ATP-binding subunit ClpA